MKHKEDFQTLLNSISKKHTQSTEPRGNSYIDAEEIIRIFEYLNEQIEEQSEIIDRCSRQLAIFQNGLKKLIRELVKRGYLQIGEKRNLSSRNSNTLEALITLLNKGKLITRRQLLSELTKKRKEYQL